MRQGIEDGIQYKEQRHQTGDSRWWARNRYVRSVDPLKNEHWTKPNSEKRVVNCMMVDPSRPQRGRLVYGGGDSSMEGKIRLW